MPDSGPALKKFHKKCRHLYISPIKLKAKLREIYYTEPMAY